MKFSTKTRYGLRAMMEIARVDQKIGIYQKDIAINQDLSVKYLDQIVHALKVANLIINIKGKKSGYILTKPAQSISILDIHNAFDGDVCIIDCLSKTIHCDRETACAAQGFWRTLNNKIIDYLKSVKLSDLLSDQIKIDDI